MTSISSSATRVPNGTSRQVWRSVADDKATCSVAARVEVARDAQKTDGEQSLKGLLLARSRDDQRQARAGDFRRRRQMRPWRHRRRARPQRALLSGKPGRRPERGQGAAHPRLRRRRARPDRRARRCARLSMRSEMVAPPLGEEWGSPMMDALRPLRLARHPARSTGVADFPAIPEGWAYLDSAATAQKPKAVIDAITRGLCRDLCDRASRRLSALGRDDPGLRGVAAAGRRRSSTRARRRRSSSSAARPRGSTSSRKAGAGDNLKPGDRVLLSALEHHSQHRALAAVAGAGAATWCR